MLTQTTTRVLEPSDLGRRARRPRPRAGRQRLRRLPRPGRRARPLAARRRDVGLVRGRQAALPLLRRRQPGPDLRHPRAPCAPSPTAPAGPAAAAPRSSAPPRPPPQLWRLLEPSWGPAREVRAHQPLMVTDSLPADIAPDPLRPPDPQGRDGHDHAGVRGDVHRGGRRLPAGRRRRPALPGPGRRTRRLRPLLRPHRRTARSSSRRRSARPPRSACQIQGVWVAPEYRGRGLAEPGMAAVLRYALRGRRPGGQPLRQRLQHRGAARRTAGSASRRSARS